MSQDLLDMAAVPSTQLLELDGHAEYYDYADYYGHGSFSDYEDSPSPEPASTPSDSEDDDEPSSHSSTPPLDPMPPAAHASSPHQHNPMQQLETWDQYSHCPFSGDGPLEVQLPKGLLIAHRFLVVRIIGCGSFGCTFKALDTHDNNAEVALKVAKGRPVFYSDGSPGRYRYDDFLQVEWECYRRLMAAEGGAPPVGYPRMLAAGVHNLCPSETLGSENWPVFRFSYLAMELLGPTVWNACSHMRHNAAAGQEAGADCDAGPDTKNHVQEAPEAAAPATPSRAWIVKTGKGMLKALADIHWRGYIHRDVKTENWVLAADGTNESVFLIDFGFSRPAYGHYSFDSDYELRCASFWGTPNYASVSSLLSYPQTPRDDLEAVCYCLFEMECPKLRLPWNHTLTTNSEAAAGWSTKQLEEMANKKCAAWKAACKEGAVPAYLMGYLEYLVNLGPQDIPDYAWLLMQLDSGSSNEPPRRAPLRRILADWPSVGSTYNHSEYSQYAISQVAAAASKILPSSVVRHRLLQQSPMRQQHKHALHLGADEQQQQPARKRLKSVIVQCAEPADGAEQHDFDPQPSQAEAEGSIDASCEGDADEKQLQQCWSPRTQHCPPGSDAKKLGCEENLFAWPLLAGSQTDVEE